MMQKLLFIVLVCFFISPHFALAKTPKLLEHLEQDAKETFLRWPALLIGGGVVTAAALTQADQSIQESFRSGRHLGKADTFFRHLGAPYVIDSSALAAFGVGAIARNETWIRTGETLLESLGFTESATLGLKLAFRRERPDSGRYGFPSGHASRVFAAATVLETLQGPYVGIPSYIVAGLVSFSRLDENRHNLSDIVFGGALGAAVGWGTARFHKKKTTKLLILPMSNHSAGLSLSGLF